MEYERKIIRKDLIVAGAGMPGICAAIQAARLGLSVALVNDRGYLGGNASAEIYVQVNGANVNEFNFFSRETGIIEEIRLENLYRNPQANRYIWDSVLFDFILREKNIELFLNTNIDETCMRDSQTIEYISGSQQDSETRFVFYGRLFLDNTGDGTVGYLAGADFRMGREARDEYQERIAPEQADDAVLLSTLTFNGRDTGRPVRYIPPEFALDLENSGILKNRVIPKIGFERCQWYYELGGGLDQIRDTETITRAHKALVYGIWNHIKNSGQYAAEQYDLEFVSCIPGKRESRRLLGDHILREDDIVSQRDFPDTVGHGGWNIDLHAVLGLYDTDIINRHIFIDGIYQIPYRCGYSRNISNLFMAGRCMSTTHVAFGSTRVIATLCTLAQALGAAASLCLKYNTTPRGIYLSYLEELQQTLLRQDQFIIGKALSDPDDLARVAKVTTTSARKCQMLQMDHAEPLDQDIAMTIPVMNRLDQVRILVLSPEAADLAYQVYHTGKRENFCPKDMICSGTVRLEGSADWQWINLAVHEAADSQYVLLQLQACHGVSIAMAAERLAGMMAIRRKDNRAENIIDAATLHMKQSVWQKLSGLPCFSLVPEEPVYGGHNLVNEYTRPYGLPNVWLSDDKVANETISLSWDKNAMIDEVVLRFDTNLDYLISHQYSAFNTMPETARDYDIYIRTRGSFIKAGQMRGNYQRVNRIKIDPVEADALKIVFLATQGACRVGVYQVHVYKSNPDK